MSNHTIKVRTDFVPTRHINNITKGKVYEAAPIGTITAPHIYTLRSDKDNILSIIVNGDFGCAYLDGGRWEIVK